MAYGPPKEALCLRGTPIRIAFHTRHDQRVPPHLARVLRADTRALELVRGSDGLRVPALARFRYRGVPGKVTIEVLNIEGSHPRSQPVDQANRFETWVSNGLKSRWLRALVLVAEGKNLLSRAVAASPVGLLTHSGAFALASK